MADVLGVIWRTVTSYCAIFRVVFEAESEIQAVWVAQRTWLFWKMVDIEMLYSPGNKQEQRFCGRIRHRLYTPVLSSCPRRTGDSKKSFWGYNICDVLSSLLIKKSLWGVRMTFCWYNLRKEGFKACSPCQPSYFLFPPPILWNQGLSKLLLLFVFLCEKSEEEKSAEVRISKICWL